MGIGVPLMLGVAAEARRVAGRALAAGLVPGLRARRVFHRVARRRHRLRHRRRRVARALAGAARAPGDAGGHRRRNGDPARRRGQPPDPARGADDRGGASTPATTSFRSSCSSAPASRCCRRRSSWPTATWSGPAWTRVSRAQARGDRDSPVRRVVAVFVSSPAGVRQARRQVAGVQGAARRHQGRRRRKPVRAPAERDLPRPLPVLAGGGGRAGRAPAQGHRLGDVRVLVGAPRDDRRVRPRRALALHADLRGARARRVRADRRLRRAADARRRGPRAAGAARGPQPACRRGCRRRLGLGVTAAYEWIWQMAAMAAVLALLGAVALAGRLISTRPPSRRASSASGPPAWTAIAATPARVVAVVLALLALPVIGLTLSGAANLRRQPGRGRVEPVLGAARRRRRPAGPALRRLAQAAEGADARARGSLTRRAAAPLAQRRGTSRRTGAPGSCARASRPSWGVTRGGRALPPRARAQSASRTSSRRMTEDSTSSSSAPRRMRHGAVRSVAVVAAVSAPAADPRRLGAGSARSPRPASRCCSSRSPRSERSCRMRSGDEDLLHVGQRQARELRDLGPVEVAAEAQRDDLARRGRARPAPPRARREPETAARRACRRQPLLRDRRGSIAPGARRSTGSGRSAGCARSSAATC